MLGGEAAAVVAGMLPVVDAGMLGVDEVVTTRRGKAIVSVLALAAAIGAAVLARRGRDWIADRFRPSVADVVVPIGVLAVFAAAVTVILDAWELSNDVLNVLGTPDGRTVPKLMVTGIIVVGGYVLTSAIRRLLDDLIGNSDAVTEHQREVTFRLSQLVVWILAVITVLGVWQVNLEGLLIGAGFLGIVVGMAARQTLGALLAGFVLMLSRPFEIGDWIEIGPDGQEGIVKDITMMNTRIQTFDGEYVMVPNDVIGSQSLTNRSRKGRLRLEIEVGVDYDADVDRAVELADDAVDDIEESLDVPSPETVIKHFADSSVVLGVRFWIDNPSARRRWRARTAAISAVKNAFEEAGITIPFPQRTVGGREDGGRDAAIGSEAPVPEAAGGDE
ncbi:Small-conductance mechanosensitive channel [Natronoarchaeum philippinense]|uniref:Small-conductance mechanosensitive channel n=1 Tax=Natronoarchaeum philippinense TaxID=558529 RepID=A0A285N473_NATPI|nr:mechanosensitive ion channel family protein [Natronoarchaeum philippinense]SNZ04239.1 Small-conductance mechanosensitive channel [Natronoarchaeum philippinense]